MEKTINIDGKEVRLRATAAVPRLYRIKFGRDIMQDLSKLSDAYEKATTEQEQFEATDLGLFENVAYIMAKHADKDAVPSSVEEWLDSFEVFSIYQVLPEILTLWNLNTLTTAKPKKTRVSTREMTTPLFLLRCVQMGIALRDLDLLTVGMVNDMAIERENDDYKWPLKAMQADIDKFFG